MSSYILVYEPMTMGTSQKNVKRGNGIDPLLYNLQLTG